MHWIGINEISAKLHIPHGYRIEQLKRSAIPELVRSLDIWYPDMTVGAERCFLREDFYDGQVCCEGEPEKDVIVVLARKDQELAGFFFSREGTRRAYPLRAHRSSCAGASG